MGKGGDCYKDRGNKREENGRSLMIGGGKGRGWNVRVSLEQEKNLYTESCAPF